MSNYEELEQKIKELRHGDHLCCIYENDEEHRALITPFISQGLHLGEKIFYIVDARTAEEIISYLREDGLEIGTVRQCGFATFLRRSLDMLPCMQF